MCTGAFRGFELEFECANSLLPRRGVKSRSRSRSRDRNTRDQRDRNQRGPDPRRRRSASPAGRERRSPRCALIKMRFFFFFFFFAIDLCVFSEMLMSFCIFPQL